jgi:hypothetical protein
MLTEEQIRQEINGAEENSDIHGLVEKIAYFFHIKTPEASAIENWDYSKDTLYRWSDCKYRPDLKDGPSFGERIHGVLSNSAYDKYKTRLFFHDSPNSYADWMTAQHELGKQVLWQERGIIVDRVEPKFF